MGYMRHHAIIVTGCFDDSLDKAHAYARERFRLVSEISGIATNGYRSFFVPPDGSKEGWDESDIGDEARKNFVEYLKDRRHGGWLNWCEVQYGDDGYDDRLLESDRVPRVAEEVK